MQRLQPAAAAAGRTETRRAQPHQRITASSQLHCFLLAMYLIIGEQTLGKLIRNCERKEMYFISPVKYAGVQSRDPGKLKIRSLNKQARL